MDLFSSPIYQKTIKAFLYGPSPKHSGVPWPLNGGSCSVYRPLVRVMACSRWVGGPVLTHSLCWRARTRSAVPNPLRMWSRMWPKVRADGGRFVTFHQTCPRFSSRRRVRIRDGNIFIILTSWNGPFEIIIKKDRFGIAKKIKNTAMTRVKEAFGVVSDHTGKRGWNERRMVRRKVKKRRKIEREREIKRDQRKEWRRRRQPGFHRTLAQNLSNISERLINTVVKWLSCPLSDVTQRENVFSPLVVISRSLAVDVLSAGRSISALVELSPTYFLS